MVQELEEMLDVEGKEKEGILGTACALVVVAFVAAVDRIEVVAIVVD